MIWLSLDNYNGVSWTNCHEKSLEKESLDGCYGEDLGRLSRRNRGRRYAVRRLSRVLCLAEVVLDGLSYRGCRRGTAMQWLS